jgi:hypothetical protein
MQKELKDRKWQKMPKIFKHALELHSNEILNYQDALENLK